MMCLLLTAGQADHVRGPVESGLAALDPVQLVDGRWVLPVAVLADPLLAERHAYLDALPRLDVTDDLWVRDPEEEDEPAA